jgi:hypothetical protein
MIDGNELCLVHVSLMDAYATAGATDKAISEAAWLSSHRGRAYVEYGAERVLAPFNIAQADLALLRASELLRKAGALERAKQSLDAFRHAWPGSESLDFVSPRVRAARGAEKPQPID